MNLTEHEEQRLVVDWLDWQGFGGFFFAVPNGTNRAHSQTSKLKAEGMRNGVPDLWIPTMRIVIEMKRRNARPSDTRPEQAAWIQRLKDAGWEARVCKGADEAIAWLRELGLERRAKPAEPSRVTDHMRGEGGTVLRLRPRR